MSDVQTYFIDVYYFFGINYDDIILGVYNLVGIVFLFLFFIPNIGSVWMNYALVGSTAIVIPAVLVTRERYNRTQVDQLVEDNT